MLLLCGPMFVVQRRINAPPDCVLRTISNPEVFGGGCVLAADDEGSLLLDEPFRRIDSGPRTTWRARARLLSPRRRTIGEVEVEIGPWSAGATELLIRPRARNPYRWSGRRIERYFRHAHRRADDLTRLLVRTAAVSGRQRSREPAPSG